MASESSHQRKKTRKRFRLQSDQEVERLDSLPWNSSLPKTYGGAEDDFSLFTGSNELEGGVLSLEEISDVDYRFEIPNVNVEGEREEFKGKINSKKQKKNGGDAEDSCSGEVGLSKEHEKDAGKQKKKKKTKKDKKKKKDHPKNDEADEVAKQTTTADTDGDNGDDKEDLVDEEEYCAWSELRLHPRIMKSIYKLKFLEPTPIQKACILAGSHQGKDVIGAAETGSGKTLAFGLPILQRLLEEQDKLERILAEEGEANERIAPHGVLRALILAPTRELANQVTDHLKEVALGTNVRVLPIVGGMSREKQERLLKSRPEIVVGTPGRLWKLMSGGETHLVELHSLSFFVLDEADRMIEFGHFRELQSIIDMLPTDKESNGGHPQNTQNCVTVANVQRKKRQTFVFSATLGLSSNFRMKLKHGSLNAKKDEISSIVALTEKAGMRTNAAIVDLTNASILAHKIIESVIECREEEKEAYLYYILSVHGQGRTIVFCTSISAIRRISSLLRILNINAWTFHAEMQQKARLKSIECFRAQEHGILVATEGAARGLDIPAVRTVVHYQLPLSAEVYVHRCGRTARASSDGCSIALISPNDASKFAALCKSFSKESFQRFPVEPSYMPEIKKRISLAHQVDKIVRKESQEKAERHWVERNAKSVGLDQDDNDSEEERVEKYRRKKAKSNQLNKLQEELNTLLSKPLHPKTFSKRYLAGGGVSPLLQRQFEELARQKSDNGETSDQNKRRKLVVIGQDQVEPLQALKSASKEACLDLKGIAEKQKNSDNLRKKRKEMKKRLHEQRRKQRKKLQKRDA